MNRIANALAPALLLAACASGDPAPQGALAFGVPPEGLVHARPVEIDGRRVHEDELGRAFFLGAGPHRLRVVPEGADEDPAPAQVVVLVEPGLTRHVALREAGEGEWHVVVWGESAFDPRGREATARTPSEE